MELTRRRAIGLLLASTGLRIEDTPRISREQAEALLASARQNLTQMSASTEQLTDVLLQLGQAFAKMERQIQEAIEAANVAEAVATAAKELE